MKALKLTILSKKEYSSSIRKNSNYPKNDQTDKNGKILLNSVKDIKINHLIKIDTFLFHI
ncbi:hypothetical protein HMPREF1420_01568 [Helicobacter pylori GAM264Ai]|nr:hypothetical protein HMPREF1420_01568 [Helicobacter pylori GAM264Ai]